jgi:hypothetical protein
MGSNLQPIRPGSEASLITRAMIEATMREIAEQAEQGTCDLLDRESVLHEFIEARLLQLAGQMSIAGSSTQMVRGVSVAVHFLLNVTATVVAKAHRELWADFLPTSDDEKREPGPGQKKRTPKRKSEQDPPNEGQQNENGR